MYQGVDELIVGLNWKDSAAQTFGLHFKMVLTSSFMPYSRQSAPCTGLQYSNGNPGL